MTGEQHERAVEAAAQDAFWKDDKGGHIKGRWTWGTIPEAGRENYRQTITAAIDAYLASLREQGVVLVDLREVVQELREWVKYREDRLPHYGNRTQRADGEAWVLDALDAKLDDLSERRFGGNERSES